MNEKKNQDKKEEVTKLEKKRPRNWYLKDFTNEFIFLKRR